VAAGISNRATGLGKAFDRTTASTCGKLTQLSRKEVAS
jgi:hypothetical protein